MKIFRKIKTFILLGKSSMFLLFEAYLFLGFARVLKSIPFSKVAPILGAKMEETSSYYNEHDLANIRKISEAVHIMSRHTFWESQCLVRAIAAMKMLERRQIDSTLYLGTARDEAGNMIAHAWLRSGPFYITGFEGMNKFVVVGKFAKRVSI